jgi:predicted short-subunit dehydrogenase-like oxidoreductase (DUF2520 family)
MKFNLIGAGNVGTTLGLLFVRAGIALNSIYSRTEISAQNAQRHIGAGAIVSNIVDLPFADITIIATSDHAIEMVAQDIANHARLQKGSIVFHCSGALPSSVMAGLRDKGVFIASIHPAKSFTNPLHDADNFPGTYCGIEGDAKAIEVLSPLFKKLKAEIFEIKPEQKTLYHAGTVMACNYLAPLLDAAIKCHADAGIDRQTSWNILAPLIRDTIANIGNLGAARALTGPIARGDDEIVRAHLAEIAKKDPARASLYTALGLATIPLARDKGVADDHKLNALQDFLTGHSQ